VVLDNCDLAEAQRIAEKIRERIAQERLDIHRAHFAVTLSVGV
jgi:GGDEF domain-containing protein